MENIVFLVVRTSSKRLPKKILEKINGEFLIEFLIGRISRSVKLENIIVCTTSDESDNSLCEYLSKINIKFFRGDKENVLNRLHSAAKNFSVSRFIVVEGDDVLCEPELIAKTSQQLEKSGEVVFWKNLPIGVSPIGMKLKGLEKLVQQKIGSRSDTGWGKAIIDSGLVKVVEIEPEEKIMRPEFRLTVDYKEDLELVRKLISSLPVHFTLLDIINKLDANPEWIKINEDARKKYDENFKRKAVN